VSEKEIGLGPFRDALGTAVASETRAYGFTLLVWSTGALTTADQGLPTTGEVFAFLCGALLAMAIVVLVAFGGPMRRWTTSREPHYAFGAIHIASLAVGTACGWGVCLVLGGWAAFAGGAVRGGPRLSAPARTRGGGVLREGPPRGYALIRSLSGSYIGRRDARAGTFTSATSSSHFAAAIESAGIPASSSTMPRPTAPPRVWP
jgi:hypothetical protein